MADDTISRQALKDAMYHEAFEVDSELQKWDGGCWIRYKMFENVIDDVPSAQPEITLESAIDYLHDIGWMQEHDRIMAESAQPEIMRKGEPMNDLISRKAAIEALREKVFHNLSDEFYGAMQVLDELPSAERTGRWIKHGEPPWYVIECSECGAKWQMSGSWDANNFCGNCGAKMDEEASG